MGAMEEEQAPGSSSTGSSHLNNNHPQPNVPLPSSINGTSMECATTRDSASFVTGNTLIIPFGVPTEQALTTLDKTTPTTTDSAVITTGTASNTTDSATGRTTCATADINSATTDSTLMTNGTSSITGLVLNTPDTTLFNNEIVTPAPSTAPNTSPIFRTTTDIGSPWTNRALDATSKTNDAVPGTTGTTSTTDIALTMKGIALMTPGAVLTMTGTTPSTTGSFLNTQDTAIVNTETVTPTPSTALTTSPMFRTTTDIVSPKTDRALDTDPKTTDVVAAITDPTATTDTALTMKGIALTITDAVLPLTQTTPAIVNTEIVTPAPSTALTTSPIFRTTTDIVSPRTYRALDATPKTTDVVPVTMDTTSSTDVVQDMTCITPSTTSSFINTPDTAKINSETVTPTLSTAPTPSLIFRTTTDIDSPRIDRALDADPKTTDVVAAITDSTATTDTALTMKGIALTITDAVLPLTQTTPATQDTASATIDYTQTANSISTAKAAIATVATDVSPSSLSPQSNGAPMEQDEPIGYSPILQSSSQRKENASTTSALSLLSSYGVSDSEEECDSDNMDISCDNANNESLLVNGTLENVTSHVPLELQGDSIMKPLCDSSSLNSNQIIHPANVQEKISNGIVGDASRCDTPDIDIVVSGSYRHTVDVGSGTDDSEDDSESSSSSEYESSSDESEETSSGIVEVRVISKTVKSTSSKRDILLTPGEVLIGDLPPIEDLHISVPEEQARPIGTVFSIVEQQVVVEAFPNIPPIDLDSVLFLDHGERALGHIFDVFGPVQQPFYVVRFNSAEHVKGCKIDPGDLVYFAPSTEHTSFIVIDDLMKIKGSDACGLAGNELMPYDCHDFSDDEEEARALRGSKQAKYTSSTNEFQPQKKRGRGQVNIRGHGRGRSETQGENSFHNPFRSHGISRDYHRFGNPTMMQPRFGPRGPPPFPMGPPNCMRGPPMRPPQPFIQGSPRMPQNPGAYEPRPFSHFHNQMEMAGDQDVAVIPPEAERYHNTPHSNTDGWPQPPPFQFGGPPQFRISRGCFPSPGVASPHGIHSHPHPPPPTPPPPPPSPFGNSFQHGGPPGSFNEMMHSSHTHASSGVESARIEERGWFPQQLAEPHMLPTPEQHPPQSPLHSIPPPPPSPTQSMPPPPGYSIPPPFPSPNIPPPFPSPNIPPQFPSYNIPPPFPSQNIPPPFPSHNIPPPFPSHNIPPPFPSHNIPPPFPSHNMQPPPAAHNMPTLPTAPYPPPPPPPYQMPFDPSQLPPPLPPVSY